MAHVTARILILAASVREGHDLPARLLADQLRDESPGTEAVVADGLRAIGRTFALVNERAAGVVFFRFRRPGDAAYGLFVHFAPTRRLTRRFEGARSRALASRHAPDLSFAAFPSAASLVLRPIA